MIGLPGDPNIPLADVLIGELDKQWIAYWDNGTVSVNSSEYYVKYDGSSTFNFTRGRSFWIISMNDITISQTIPTENLNANDEIIITLHDQWNLITNPFLETVSWSAVKSVNGDISYELFEYDQAGRHTTTSMVPYEGYHVQNTLNLSELILKTFRQIIGISWNGKRN